MDAKDASEIISELREEKAEHAAADRFRDRAALLVAGLAAVLAVGGLGGGNATDDLIGANIHASDSWAFYQAKNIRQTQYEIAAAELEAELSEPGLSPEDRAAAQARLAEYKATIARYDDEPDPEAPNDLLRGEGKKQLRARAESWEHRRELAAARDDNFDLAEVALQLALVLASIAILAVKRSVLLASAILGVIGTLLTINGFLVLVPLPG